MIAATPNERVCLQNCFDTGSGEYWVRRMRRLPRAPLLENTAYISYFAIFLPKSWSPLKKKGLHFDLISNFS